MDSNIKKREVPDLGLAAREFYQELLIINKEN